MAQDIKKTDKKIARRTLPGLLIFLLKELLYQKRWVLLPLWVLLAVITLVLLLSGSSFILPAIYIVGF